MPGGGCVSYEIVNVTVDEFRSSPSARLVDPDAIEAMALIEAGSVEAFAASEIATRRGAAWCAAIARRSLDEWERDIRRATVVH